MTVTDSELSAQHIAGMPVDELAKRHHMSERDVWKALTRVGRERLSGRPMSKGDVERNRRIIKLRRDGLEATAIACRLGCRMADVNLTLAIAGDPWNDTMTSSDEIMALLAARGWTRIADESGANPSRARRAIRLHCESSSPDGDCPSNMSWQDSEKRSPTDRERNILALRRTNFTQFKVAQHVGVSRSTVGRVLAAYGDPLARGGCVSSQTDACSSRIGEPQSKEVL